MDTLYVKFLFAFSCFFITSLLFPITHVLDTLRQSLPNAANGWHVEKYLILLQKQYNIIIKNSKNNHLTKT